ncbi:MULTISPECIES: gamma-glutamylcyclotransferase [unclassified Leptolyngbya]|uniref:allophanate hydrolase-related protein n=1 Tax=unclassified Leptolyngbya TaxID=2650499 RepID=UPI00168269EE|nr:MULTISPECIES: gamma-glutamylcyclotransferase [unclassified Leptolyngbya]MBD1912780.1 gamma-glutamylcyclotransferase [Leptolyngbya sp. FACHB-8]MBD2157727.1 gamma-glutamylcyclotransferase [Leptolyngbya sp. FACHB-16]
MTETRRVFICGSALRGQPDHQNLGEAKFIAEAKTQPLYRLHSVQNGWHPGIYEVEEGGISIPGEVYEMTIEQFDYLATNEPPHMYPVEVPLQDGGVATAFLYPREKVEEYGWEDISNYGGWVAYKQSVTATA